MKRTLPVLLFLLLGMLCFLSGCVLFDFLDDLQDTLPTHSPGDQKTYAVDGVTFNVRYAAGKTFPMGISNSEEGTVPKDFWIAETPVNYELWYTVLTWAENQGYVFSNAGREGSSGSTGEAPSGAKYEPVTSINWRDVLVWCNALSEYLELEPVYRYLGSPVRDAGDAIACDNAVMAEVNGFRLPTSNEWELAARYQGSDASRNAIEYPKDSGIYWTPGNYASGADADYTSVEATKKVAWYRENSDTEGTGFQTQAVAQKPSGGNSLGLYDMSGNIWEWCFDTIFGSNRVLRGGCFSSYADSLQVGGKGHSTIDPSSTQGFRLVKNP